MKSDLGSWRSKQEMEKLLEEGYSTSKNLEMEVNWLEWRRCIERL